MNDVFDIPPKKATVVPQAWLDQVDNKSMTPAPRSTPYQRQPSLWDQRTPYGFETLSEKEVREISKKKEKKDLDMDMTDWPYGDSYVPGPLDKLGMEDYADIPGFDDDDAAEYARMYGKEAAEAYSLVDDFLSNLEHCDEPLHDIISMCYEMLTENGKMKIAHEGLR